MNTSLMSPICRICTTAALLLVAHVCVAQDIASPPLTTLRGILTGTDHCPAAWTYEGDTGPSHWMSMGYPDCGNPVQSPVDLHKFKKQTGAALGFAYTEGAATVTNTGSTLLVKSANFGSASLPNGPWTLTQFHFHFPSEHKLNGKRWDGEIHLVHENSAGAVAVVAVFIDAGSQNDFFDPIIAAHGVACATTTLTNAVDPTDLLPDERSFFSYTGTLTTPPCAPDVAWYVMQDPIKASSAQIAALKAAAGLDNARPYAHNINPVTFTKVQ